MLHIGEFSALTGLTVKGLRHYDEEGLLTPSSVDAHSGRRHYSPGQVRDGLTVRALRDADVPLPVVARVLGSATGADDLAQHRERVLEDRARQDQAFSAAMQALAGPVGAVEVTRRDAPEQRFVGRPVDDTVDRDGTADESWPTRVLAAAGIDPTGPHWITTRVRDRDVHDVMLCWPVDESTLSDELPGLVVGTLPRRSELVARRRADGDQLADAAWYGEALTRLVEALAEVPRPHRDGFVLRQQVTPVAGGSWDVELSVAS